MSSGPIEPSLAAPQSVAEFYAQALAIEEEASARYAELAAQMEVHNNREAAALFRRMAAIEGEHQAELARRAGAALSAGAPKRFSWLDPEGPETTDFGDVHYLMTPHHALCLARVNEARAAAFFESVAETATDPDIKLIAREMADEEREHVAWVDEWLKSYPAPEDDWHVDPDPPVYSE